jgi:hypothetical protein
MGRVIDGGVWRAWSRASLTCRERRVWRATAASWLSDKLRWSAGGCLPVAVKMGNGDWQFELCGSVDVVAVAVAVYGDIRGSTGSTQPSGIDR